jgi:hypothetical protein
MKLFSSVAMAGLVALWMTGCTTSTDSPPAQPPVGDPHAGHEPDAHEHGEHGAGPHGGTIGEWGGGKYHIEFTVDHAKQQATVYILEDDVKTPAPIKADKLTLALNEPSVQIELAAQPLEGESAGVSSRFVGANEALGKEQEFAGSVTAEVEGTPYTGDFKEEAGHHDEKGK